MLKETVKDVGGRVLSMGPVGLQTYVKETVELMFWRRELRRSNGEFYNGHFKRNFTDLFGLDDAYFAGKRMLDVGCGPLGSLEWADQAAERVGVDSLADRYRELNKGKHAMRYVNAGFEDLPFDDGSFDVVSTFNALDHVEDAGAAIREAQRVLAPGGDLLLIVEINHAPTLTEPQTLKVDILDKFDDCDEVDRKVFAINERHDVYASIAEAKPPASPEAEAILCARLVKR
ncbi:MAG: class I SAM-dependent methyltransferase [Pseudomonadota bacterium]